MGGILAGVREGDVYAVIPQRHCYLTKKPRSQNQQWTLSSL